MMLRDDAEFYSNAFQAFDVGAYQVMENCAVNDLFRRAWPNYDPGKYFCELTHSRSDAGPVPHWLAERLTEIGMDALLARAAAAESELMDLGVTFTVYSDATAIDRILPFDCIPQDHYEQRMGAVGKSLHSARRGAELRFWAIFMARRRSSRTGSSPPN